MMWTYIASLFTLPTAFTGLLAFTDRSRYG